MPEDFSTTSSRLPELLGIGGLPRSGKDTLADFLMAYGYYGVSLGDIVRHVARERHAGKPDPISTTNTTETANWLRSVRGADFALRMALERYEAHKQNVPDAKGLLVYSVRARVEVDFIRAHGGGLIWLDAPDDLRYQRYLEHLRTGELPITQAELLAEEAVQWQPRKDIDPAIQMNVAYVRDHATISLHNDSHSIDVFLEQARRVLFGA